MSILRRILGETRAVGGTWITDNQPLVSSAGVAINSQTALSIGAYYAAVKLYSDTVASLPWDTYIRVDGTRWIQPRDDSCYEPDDHNQPDECEHGV